MELANISSGKKITLHHQIAYREYPTKPFLLAIHKVSVKLQKKDGGVIQIGMAVSEKLSKAKDVALLQATEYIFAME